MKARAQDVLALDLGTSWCKAAVIAIDGDVVGEGACWVRDDRLFGHDAEALGRIWEAASAAIRQARQSAARETHPAALALASRKAPGTWLDRDGQPLGLDPETAARIGREEIEACYASSLWRQDDPFAYGYAIDLIGNTRWLWRNRPHIWEHIHRAGNLHSWLLWRLTGRWLTSHAGGPVRDRWPETVWELSGLPPTAYPAVAEDVAVAGRLLPDAAKHLGLEAGTLVATGTHDGAAANIGAGAIEPGDACLTFGTNGVLRVVTGERLPRRFGYAVTGGRWALVRDLPDLSRLIDQVIGLIDGSDDPVHPDRHEQLARLAAGVPPGANGLRLKLFPDAGGVSPETALERSIPFPVMYRALLEAVALGFTGLVQQARHAGAPPRRYIATGGGSNNELLLRITSACLDAPIEKPDGPSGALGLAAIAHTAAGHFPDLRAAIQRLVVDPQRHMATQAEIDIYSSMVQGARLPAGTAPGDAVAGG